MDRDEDQPLRAKNVEEGCILSGNREQEVRMLLNYKNWQSECLKRCDCKLWGVFSSEESLVITKIFLISLSHF